MKPKLYLILFIALLIVAIPIGRSYSRHIEAKTAYQVQMDNISINEQQATSSARIAAKKAIIWSGAGVVITLALATSGILLAFAYTRTRIAQLPVAQLVGEGVYVIADGSSHYLLDTYTGYRASLSQPAAVEKLRAEVVSRKQLTDNLNKSPTGQDWLVSTAVTHQLSAALEE